MSEQGQTAMTPTQDMLATGMQQASYHFTSEGLSKYLDAVRAAWEAQRQPASTSSEAALVELFSAMEQECWSLKCESYPTGAGDADIGWEVVSHHQGKPHERTEGQGKTPIEALRSALTAKA